MPNFIQKFKDFQTISNALDRLNGMIEEAYEELKKGHDPSDMVSEVAICAYLFKRDVTNILDKYGESWNGEAKFIAPSISNNKITLTQAIAVVIGKILAAAGMIERTTLINDILEGGESYFSVKNMLPKELR